MKQTEDKGIRNFHEDEPMETLEIGNALYSTRLTDKFRNRVKWEKPDEKKVCAVIPGTIQKIFVKEGDRVQAGEALLILEAMKMRNEVCSPQDGVIGTINVAVGEHVPKDFLLVEFK